jgi:hypothetical protein
MPLACIPEVTGLNPGYDASYVTEVFRAVPQSLQANEGIMPQMDHDRFLPQSYQFINH